MHFILPDRNVLHSVPHATSHQRLDIPHFNPSRWECGVQDTLDAFLELGGPTWRRVRENLQQALQDWNTDDADAQLSRALLKQARL